MPAHFQQSVLQQLIPMLVVLSIVAALPSLRVRSRAKESTSLNDNDQSSALQAGAGEAPIEIHTPDYEFAYGVQDPATGDHKDQWERRVGDSVKGVYTFEEADGTQRIVEYEAEGDRGFRAIVTNVELRKATAGQGPAQHDMAAHSYNMLRATSS